MVVGTTNKISELLDGLNFMADYQFAARGERSLLCDFIERLRRDENHTIQKYSASLGKLNLNTPAWITSSRTAFFHLLPAGLFCHEEYVMAKMSQRQVSLVDGIQKLLWPVTPDKEWNSNDSTGNGFGADFYDLNLEKFAYTQSLVDMATVACALENYRLLPQQYPPSLSELATQFISVASLPHDVMYGGPLNYARMDPDHFHLYSIGSNGTDDHGTQTLTADGTLDLEKGDWVWPAEIKNR